MTDAVYPTRLDLARDIVGMLRKEIAALHEEGAAYIQLDSLHYVERVADTTIRARMIADGEDPDHYLDELIAIDNATLEGARREGVTVGMHMCRGNNRSAWHAEGSYEPIAEKAFSQLNVDRFLLEYDTERAGGFEPLRFVPKDKMVVLGLISSKEPGARVGRSAAPPHRRGDEVRADREPGDRPAVRLRLDHARQPADLGRAAPQAGARRGDGPQSLGVRRAESLSARRGRTLHGCLVASCSFWRTKLCGSEWPVSGVDLHVFFDQPLDFVDVLRQVDGHAVRLVRFPGRGPVHLADVVLGIVEVQARPRCRVRSRCGTDRVVLEAVVVLTTSSSFSQLNEICWTHVCCSGPLDLKITNSWCSRSGSELMKTAFGLSSATCSPMTRE